MAQDWNGVTHGARGLAALALDGEPHWLDRATERVGRYFDFSHDRTAAGYQGVTCLAYGLQSTVRFAIALARRGRPDLIEEATALRGIPHHVLWQLLPWGRGIMPVNQSGTMLQPAGGVFHLMSRYQGRAGRWG